MIIQKIESLDIPVFGGEYRGKCPKESAEQVTVINQIRKHCPQVIHPRNEGKNHYMQVQRYKAQGQTKGASDIIVPGCPAFVCELKRKDPTKSVIEEEQLQYLEDCRRFGAFVCVAFGHEAALVAFNQWLDIVSGNN